MHRLLLCSVALALTAWAADAWVKVKDLKSGTELRIFKKGVRQPILATFEDLNEDSLIVATKKEEIAVPKDQIERLDARPVTKSRVTTETRTTDGPDTLGPPTQNARPAPSSSTSSNLSFGSKPDFETVYRATAASQK